MTINDMWEEYRVKCCLLDEETSELIYWQRMAFCTAVAATVGKLNENPEGFTELHASVLEWVQKEFAGANRHDQQTSASLVPGATLEESGSCR